MFAELFSYSPDDIEPKYRERMAQILRARGELLRATSEVIDLRGRAWAGEPGLTAIIDLKAAALTALRRDYQQVAVSFAKETIDVDGLLEFLPLILTGILSKFHVPLPVVLEALGADVDGLKLLAELLKKLVDGADG